MAMKDESNDYEGHNDLGICTLFDGHDEVLKGGISAHSKHHHWNANIDVPVSSTTKPTR